MQPITPITSPLIPLNRIAEFLSFTFRPIRRARTAQLNGKVYLRYSGAYLRKIRARNGVGRPPGIALTTRHSRTIEE